MIPLLKTCVDKGMRPDLSGTRYKKFSTLKASILCILIILSPSLSYAGVLFEQQGIYIVTPGDTLGALAGHLGVSAKRIARDNSLDPAAPLKAGKRLRVTTRKIIPETVQKGILIDIPGRMLYLFEDGAPIMAVPVGLGMPKGNGKKGWETPAGAFTVTGKLKSPAWKVPRSIQEEMRREGAAVKESYPPGPKNPVGGYVLLTTLPGILIHETIDPSSIYRYLSHGCVRVLSEDMKELFDYAADNMPGKIVYTPIKIASRSDGKVFMEAHKDVYGKISDMRAEAQRLLGKSGVLGFVDHNKVAKVVQEMRGIPEEVTAKGP